jgi:hypothetical protein
MRVRDFLQPATPEGPDHPFPPAGRAPKRHASKSFGRAAIPSCPQFGFHPRPTGGGTSRAGGE